MVKRLAHSSSKKARPLPAVWLRSQRRKLEDQREDLRREIEEEVTLLGTTGTSHLREGGDLAEEEREDDEAAETLDVLQAKLKAVREAMARLGRGSYGVCASCRRPIPRRRLQAVPSAVRCVACQKAFEKRSGSASRGRS